MPYEAFVTLSVELHFGRTAAKLHVSQPALSKQIKRLEAELGGRLFDRTTGRVSLKPAGEALKERSRMLLGEAAALEAFGQQAMRGEVGNLRIGFGIATVNELLPRSVIAFRKAYPNVLLEMQDMPTKSKSMHFWTEVSTGICPAACIQSSDRNQTLT